MPLTGYTDPTVHVLSLFNEYWLAGMNYNYYVTRYFSGLPSHRRVAISAEIFILDTNYFEFLYFSIDGTYVKAMNPFEADTTTLVQLWGLSYGDWRFNITITALHSASTLTFGAIGFFKNDYTSFWITRLRVDTFGCFTGCSNCFLDNSFNSCTACLPGYYLDTLQCKPCALMCASCSGANNFCTACPSGFFLSTLTPGVCIVNCEPRYVADINNICQAAPPAAQFAHQRPAAPVVTPVTM